MQQLAERKKLLAFAVVIFLISGLAVAVLYLVFNRPSPPVSTCSASPKDNKLVVIVQGIGTRLDDVKSNSCYGDTKDFGTIENWLKGKQEFSSAQFMVYSYSYKPGNDGKPQPYTCGATFNQPVLNESSALRAQIEDYANMHRGTQVYIVAHSLGGVVTFGFLSSLVEDQRSLALPNGGMLKGIAIMDSPLGGVISTPGFNESIDIRKKFCGDFSNNNTTVDNLQTLYSQVQGDPKERGTNASVYCSLLHNCGRTYIRNEDVSVAAMNMGLQYVDIGNEYDLLYRPNVCHVGIDFVSSEFESERGIQYGGSLFVRWFQSGSVTFSNCIEIPITQLHHGDALTRSDVENLIYEVFEQKKVDQLTPMYGIIQGFLIPHGFLVYPKSAK
jgi:hypothetical protein